MQSNLSYTDTCANEVEFITLQFPWRFHPSLYSLGSTPEDSGRGRGIRLREDDARIPHGPRPDAGTHAHRARAQQHIGGTATRIVVAVRSGVLIPAAGFWQGIRSVTHSTES